MRWATSSDLCRYGLVEVAKSEGVALADFGR